MALHERTWRIGEVATATGLTVRALHHYDQIGLVAPSGRTSGGHRLYTSADLTVLYQVTAMRQLGLSLDQVATLLAGHTDVEQVFAQQLAHVDRQIRTARRLRQQLLAARQARGHVRNLERLGWKVTLEPLDPGTGELTARAS